MPIWKISRTLKVQQQNFGSKSDTLCAQTRACRWCTSDATFLYRSLWPPTRYAMLKAKTDAPKSTVCDSLGWIWWKAEYGYVGLWPQTTNTENNLQKLPTRLWLPSYIIQQTCLLVIYVSQHCLSRDLVSHHVSSETTRKQTQVYNKCILRLPRIQP